MLGAESQGVKRTSGAELQRVRRFIRSQVVGSQAVLWEQSHGESRSILGVELQGITWYVRSGVAGSDTLHRDQSRRES